MKKTSTVVTKLELYEMEALMENIGCIHSVSGKRGLLNIKTNQIIGKLDDYNVKYYEKAKLYTQSKTVTFEDGEKKTLMNIYDAMKETYIAEGYEVIKYLGRYQNYPLLKSKDGKFHLFDAEAYRKGVDIFDIPLDNVVHFDDIYDYFIVTEGEKKGIYQGKEGLLVTIQYDNIERKKEVIIYTKDGRQYFQRDHGEKNLVGDYDKIIEDEEHLILYCFDGDIVEAYDVQYGYLLLEEKGEDIELLCKYEPHSYTIRKGWGFKIMLDGKVGLYQSHVDRETRKGKNPDEAEVEKLADFKYDEITCGDYSGAFYLKQNEKEGLVKNGILLEPNWDKIDYLGDGYYAFYHGDFCDIALPVTIEKPIVTNCQIIKITNGGIIYQKEGKFGIFISKSRNNKLVVLDAEYDVITPLPDFKEHFKLEKDGKVGLFDGTKVVLSPKYIQLDFQKFGRVLTDYKPVVYFSLEKELGVYQLAKRSNYEYSDNGEIKFVNNKNFEKIVFLPDLMVLQDSEKTYLYNYEEELLKIFEGKISISAHLKYEDYPSKGYLYVIDGVSYFYEKGKFTSALTEEVTYYKTTYEIGTDIFEITTKSLEEHDNFCAGIDALEEEEAEKKLTEFDQNKQLVKSKYPSLQFGRITKAGE